MRGSNAVYISEILRNEIIALDLKPGTTLTRTELQKRFGTSSTPISDALLRLHEDRMVEIFPQHATRVTLIDIDEAKKDRFLRRALELEIVRNLAERSNPDDIVQLRTNLAQQKALLEIGNMIEFDKLDRDFHRLMFQQTGTLDLWEISRRRSGHLDRIRRLNLPVFGKAQEILRDHETIVQSIEDRDSAAAQRVIGDHISRSLQIAGILVDRHPDYFKLTA